MRPDKQLFTLLRDVDATHESAYSPVSAVFTARELVLPVAFAISWPDGTPCSLVENYLIEQYRDGASVREDGGSLRAIASKLTHLIRHCWMLKRDFWELDDDDIFILIKNLMEERKKTAPLVRARDNNTVRAIISTVVTFLSWLQKEFLINQKLIGPGAGYRIRLAERKTFDPYSNKSTVRLVYGRLPPKDSKEPKRPISREKRNRLWEGVSELTKSKSFVVGHSNDARLGSFLSHYLKQRRELLLELLEATGARPGELARLSVLANENCYKAQELVLDTLKRRREIQRKIKLQPGVAMRLTVFIKKHRASLISELSKKGIVSFPDDRVFIGANGRPLSERTMGCEFRRISTAAGLTDVQSCMSMFRHRYITKQVALHLEAYLGASGRTQQMMTDIDYRTILKKVATTTGHGSETSLLHYLDMAWDELGHGSKVDAVNSIDAAIDSAMTGIISLIGTLSQSQLKTNIGLQSARDFLEKIRMELRTAHLKS